MSQVGAAGVASHTGSRRGRLGGCAHVPSAVAEGAAGRGAGQPGLTLGGVGIGATEGHESEHGREGGYRGFGGKGRALFDGEEQQNRAGDQRQPSQPAAKGRAPALAGKRDQQHEAGDEKELEQKQG